MLKKNKSRKILVAPAKYLTAKGTQAAHPARVRTLLWDPTCSHLWSHQSQWRNSASVQETPGRNLFFIPQPGLAAWSSAQGSCCQWCVHVLPCPHPRALSPALGGAPCAGGVGWDVVRSWHRPTPQTAPAAPALLTCAWQLLFPGSAAKAARHPQQHKWGWLKERKMLVINSQPGRSGSENVSLIPAPFLTPLEVQCQARSALLV